MARDDVHSKFLRWIGEENGNVVLAYVADGATDIIGGMFVVKNTPKTPLPEGDTARWFLFTVSEFAEFMRENARSRNELLLMGHMSPAYQNDATPEARMLISFSRALLEKAAPPRIDELQSIDETIRSMEQYAARLESEREQRLNFEKVPEVLGTYKGLRIGEVAKIVCAIRGMWPQEFAADTVEILREVDESLANDCFLATVTAESEYPEPAIAWVKRAREVIAVWLEQSPTLDVPEFGSL